MKYHFGEKLRKIRERKKMTMKGVAEQAGISESLISQIERNKVSPAIDTLLKIVEILDVDLEYLFSDFRKKKAVKIVKFSDRNKIITSGVSFQQLSKTIDTDDEHGIEAYYLEIEPNSEKGSHDYGHKGKEMGIILEGSGEFEFGTESYELNSGDSISFSSDVPHVLKNRGETTLKAIWIITPPKHFFKEI